MRKEQDVTTTIYNLIKSRKNGMTLDEIAGRYPPKDATVLISLAELLVDGKVTTELRGQKMYCIAIEATNETETSEKMQ